MSTPTYATALRAAHSALLAGAPETDAVGAGLDALRPGRAADLGAALAQRALGVTTPDPRRRPLPTEFRTVTARLTANVTNIVTLRASRAAQSARPEPLTVAQRAEKAARQNLKDDFDACSYRRASGKWAGGTTYLDALMGAPSARGESRRVWSSNGKWSGADAHIYLRAPRHRLSMPTTLRVVDGLITLDAAHTGDGVWAATWAVQGRGFDLALKHGALLLRNGEARHFNSVDAARRAAKKETKK